MSKNYQRVRDYYISGSWTIRQVHLAVGHWITADEYKLITGEEYDP